MPNLFRLAIPTLAAAVLLAAPAAAQKTVVGKSTATLSDAIRVGDMLYVSGQLGRGDSTIQGQTTNALNTIKTLVEQGGTTMANVVKCTVFLVDLKDFQGMNSSYAAAFPKEPPARATVVVSALVVASAKVEIECIAAMPKN